MYILYLDTHDQEVVVALFKDEKMIKVVNKVSGYQHSQVVLPTIKELLDEYELSPNDLGEIVVVIGPGSFTGVRIAVTIAKTMAYTLGIPLKTIDSLFLKALSCQSVSDYYVSVLEKNGAYVGKFSKELEKIGDYAYYSKSEYEKFLLKSIVIDVDKIDFEKAIHYLRKENAVNPHSVKPLYIKRIEALKK